MGKRKSSAKPQAKVKQVLDTTFQCLFCNHEKSIICTLDKRNAIGQLHCKICGQSFQSPLTSLSQPVDVYSDWVDACEAVAEEYEKATKANGGDAAKGEQYPEIEDEDEDEEDEEDYP